MLLYWVVIEILTHYASWKETKMFFHFQSHHIITVSKRRDLQPYLRLSADDRAGQTPCPPGWAARGSIGLNWRVAIIFPRVNSVVFKLVSKTAHTTSSLFFVLSWGFVDWNFWPPIPGAHWIIHTKRIKSTQWSGRSLWSGPRKSAILNWTAILGDFHLAYFNELLLGILCDSHENRCVKSWPLWDQKLLKSFGLESRCGRGWAAILSLSPEKIKCL